jgi:hypothetical protein
MKSFEEIAKELKISKTRVSQLYWSGITKLKTYALEHPELKEYLSDTNNTQSKELLKILYDDYGRDKY